MGSGSNSLRECLPPRGSILSTAEEKIVHNSAAARTLLVWFSAGRDLVGIGPEGYHFFGDPGARPK
jgi:hypothetical protein